MNQPMNVDAGLSRWSIGTGGPRGLVAAVALTHLAKRLKRRPMTVASGVGLDNFDVSSCISHVQRAEGIFEFK